MRTLQSFRCHRQPLHLTVALAGLLAVACVHAQSAPPTSTAAGGAMDKPMTTEKRGGGGSQEMHRSMMSGMEKMQQMKASGDTDKDFATMMKMHHQQALEMAKPEIEHGRSPELKAMARKIVIDQTKEIAQLDAWMKKHP